MMGSVITSRSSFRWLSMNSRMMSTCSAEARKPVVMQSKEKPRSFQTEMDFFMYSVVSKIVNFP